MPFDAVLLSGVVRELNEFLPGARIDKLQQPTRDTVLLSVRSRQGSRKLLMSASCNHPRIHFTAASYENPPQPPMFCMLLRKHLTGGRIVGLTQPPMERAVDLCVECTDELGLPAQKHLILELMGRNSNLILTGEDGRIIDCLRRVDGEMSERRQVLPGLFCREPPKQGKKDPLQAGVEGIYEDLCAVREPKTMDAWLLDTYGGISPLIARELALLCAGDSETDIAAMDTGRRAQAAAVLAREFASFRQPLTPVLLRKGGAARDFTFRRLLQYGSYMEQTEFPDFSALLDEFYTGRDRDERMRQRAASMHKTVTNLYGRVSRKLEAQQRELAATRDRERLRQLGDIVTANLHRISRGQARLTAEDFYDPEMKQITIDLNVALSPQQNAAKFYKDYNKAKNAEKFLTCQLAQGQAEKTYLASILDELARAETERDLSDIRAELLEGGYLRDTGRQKRMKTPPSRPMEFRSSDGYVIYVGRNNRQNDFLTCKAAYKSDLWLHTQKIHGSHVIIACGGRTPPDTTVTEAAMLAAYYSQARQSQNVAVDYCPVRQVKKPGGAKPGMVVYESYTTCWVTPDPALPEKLKPTGEERP